MAVELSEKIHEQGWSAWGLRPFGQAPVGIAAAVYAVTLPKPWTLIPLNAALHATAALLLLRIVQLFLPAWKRAVLTVLPFLLYPSAMIWYTQIHKDGYSIAGTLSVIYGLIQIAQLETWQTGWKRLAPAVLWIFTGAALVWIVRPYSVQILQGLMAVLMVGLVFIFFVQAARHMLSWGRAVVAPFIFFGIVVGITPLTVGGIYEELPAEPAQLEVSPQPNWYPISWLPSRIEDQFYSLAITRQGYARGSPDARSNIDVDVDFKSAAEVVAYLPRAAEIVFLAPFPDMWFGQGSLPANTVMRRVSALEMIGIYLSLLALPLAIWRWRRRIEMWVILAFCAGMMLVYGLVVANVGTLYRMRYGYIMTLVALAIAGVLAFWEDRRQAHETSIARQETQ
jgi:hypothetical protein